MEVCKGEGWLFKYVITGFFAKRRNIPFSTPCHPWSNGKFWSSLRPESLQWIKDSWNSQHCGVNATTGKLTLLLTCLINSDQDGIVTMVQPLWKTLTVLEKATSTRRVKQSEKKEVKQSFSSWPCNSIPSHPPREVKNLCSCKELSANVPSSLIRKCRKVKTVHMAVSWWMNTLRGPPLYSGTLPADIKEQGSVPYYNIADPQSHKPSERSQTQTHFVWSM